MVQKRGSFWASEGGERDYLRERDESQGTGSDACLIRNGGEDWHLNPLSSRSRSGVGGRLEWKPAQNKKAVQEDNAGSYIVTPL